MIVSLHPRAHEFDQEGAFFIRHRACDVRLGVSDGGGASGAATLHLQSCELNEK